MWKNWRILNFFSNNWKACFGIFQEVIKRMLEVDNDFVECWKPSQTLLFKKMWVSLREKERCKKGAFFENLLFSSSFLLLPRRSLSKSLKNLILYSAYAQANAAAASVVDYFMTGRGSNTFCAQLNEDGVG